MCIDFGLRLNLSNGKTFNQRFARDEHEVHDFWRNRIIDWQDDSMRDVLNLHMIVLEGLFQGLDYA
jgi:hypothetical protein